MKIKTSYCWQAREHQSSSWSVRRFAWGSNAHKFLVWKNLCAESESG